MVLRGVGEILAGAAAFLLVGLSDWAALRGHKALRSIAVAISAVLLCAAFVGLSVGGVRFVVPVSLRIAAGVLCLPFVGLLVLSVLIEPTWAAGHTPPFPPLYTRGTYALVRHPGVHWFFFVHSLLALAMASWSLAIAVPCWTGANLALSLVQDRVLFPRIFGPAYTGYRREAPFLIPTRRSLRACCSTLTITRRVP